MGLILDLLKAAGGQLSLSSPLGRWAQALSAEADQGASAASSSQGTWGCPATVSVNDLVYVSGANTVDRANANQAAPPAYPRPAIGFVVSKPTTTSCVVQYDGELPNTFAGLQAGKLYYMGATPGAIVVEGTVLPGGDTVQQVGIARSTTKLVAVIQEAA